MTEPEGKAARQRDLSDLQRAVLVIFSGSIARSVARLLLIIFVIRLYGLDSFGYLGEVAALIELFAALASYGLPKTLLAYIERTKAEGESVSQLIVNAICLSAILASTFALFLLFVWSLIFPVDAGIPIYAVFGILLISVTELILTITRSHRIIRWDTLVKAVVKPWGFLLLCVGGYLVFVRSDLLTPVQALFAAYVSSQILGLIFAIFGLGKASKVAKYVWVRPRWAGMMQLLKSSFSTAIVDTGSFSFRRLDIILLGLIAGPAATGIYYLIQQVATIVEKMRHLFEPMAAPVLAQTKSLLVTSDHLKRLCLWIFSAQIGLSAIFVLFATPTMQIFNMDYAQFTLILGLILLGEIAEGTSGLVELPMIFNHPNIASMNIVLASISELILVTISTFYFGIIGTAAGFAVAMAILAFFRFRAARTYLKSNIIGLSYAKPIIAAMAMAAMAVTIFTFIPVDGPVKLIAITVACVFCYLLLLRLFGISMHIAKSS